MSKVCAVCGKKPAFAETSRPREDGHAARPVRREVGARGSNAHCGRIELTRAPRPHVDDGPADAEVVVAEPAGEDDALALRERALRVPAHDGARLQIDLVDARAGARDECLPVAECEVRRKDGAQRRNGYRAASARRVTDETEATMRPVARLVRGERDEVAAVEGQSA